MAFRENGRDFAVWRMLPGVAEGSLSYRYDDCRPIFRPDMLSFL